MHFFKGILMTTILVGCSILSKAQVDPLLENLRNVIPPSPNTSSIAKFGEWPVNLFTGVPSISVPIYELKGRSMSLPVSINYHAAGIRVGEVASWVGLGWALNAGGCISRTVQGLPDEIDYFQNAQNFATPNQFCNGNPISTSSYYNSIGGAATGDNDNQEDIYNLNVLGKSYRILISKDSTAQTMPTSNIKITGTFLTTPGSNNSTNSMWTVTLEDGTKLLFGGAVNTSSPYVEQINNANIPVGNFISSWYLQTMTSPTGETFTFTYSPSGTTQNTHFTQSDYISYYTNTIEADANGFAPFLYAGTSSHVGMQTVTQLSLSTISSDLATVYFIPSTTARLDLPGGVSLAEIKVISKYNGATISDWLFNYAYSQAAPGNELPASIACGTADTSYYHHRLKLMGLTQNSSNNSPAQVWSFVYNPLSLPSTLSFARITGASIMGQQPILPYCQE